MTSTNVAVSVRRMGALLLIVLSAATISARQATKPRASDEAPAIKVGILPFMDATGSSGRTAGADVSRTMQAEMTHSTNLIARVLTLDGSMRVEELDGERAVEIGRRQNVDVVFMGTVLEAKSEESSKSGWLPSIKGQSASVQVRSVNANVTLQGELYRAGSGERITTVRVSGHHSDNKFGGTAYTRFGS